MMSRLATSVLPLGVWWQDHAEVSRWLAALFAKDV